MPETFTSDVYDVPVDFQRVELDWSDEGFSFGVFHDPPGQEWNDFVHTTDEYVLVAEGRLAIDVGLERREVGPGDLVRIPRGVSHSLKTISQGGSVWLYGYGLWPDRV